MRAFRSIGPGLVFMLGALGPRDLVSNSVAGASEGTRLVWVLVAAVVVRLALLDSTARYVMATGESLIAGCGRLGRWIVLTWFALSILRRHVSALVRLMLLGAAANFVCPLPTRHSIAIWGIVSWCAGFALLYWGRYSAVEKVSKPLASVMGACMLGAVILTKPDIGGLLGEALRPAWPADGGAFSAPVVIMSIIAAAMGSFGNLRYSAFLHEKGWRSMDHLRSQRVDMLVSMAGMLVMLVLIQVAAAAALRPQGIQVKEIDDIVPIFSQVLGDAGRVLFGITLWCVSFSGFVGNSAGYGIMISDVYYRFIRPSEAVIGGSKPAGEMPAYRLLILYIFLSPLYVFATDWTPVGLMLGYGVMSIVTLPVIALIVLRLTADRGVLGEHANGWFTNLILALAVLCSLYLSWQAGVEMMGELRKI